MGGVGFLGDDPEGVAYAPCLEGVVWRDVYANEGASEAACCLEFDLKNVVFETGLCGYEGWVRALGYVFAEEEGDPSLWAFALGGVLWCAMVDLVVVRC